MNEVAIPKYFIRHAAEYAGCHPYTITNYIKRGFVAPIKDRNGNRRFTKRQLKKLRQIYRINNPE
ncbi:MAG: MerR family transcriptional regulator [Deltaproteobacteria bacterium]|nr:MerR family transcriptional regulator [Deltaproteobacteria bacterium]